MKVVVIRNIIAPLLLLSLATGCASHKKEIFIGTVLGSAVGAGVGYAFVHHGNNRQYEVRNTIITSVIFGLVTAGALAWHYRAVNQAQVELSGKYSRFRLCDPTNDPKADPSKFLDEARDGAGIPAWMPESIGKYSLLLDENTRWVFPQFRKRWLPPEREKDQLISSRFIWEIVKPGFFVSKERNPEYFLEIESGEKPAPEKNSKAKSNHQEKQQ